MKNKKENAEVEKSNGNREPDAINSVNASVAEASGEKTFIADLAKIYNTEANAESVARAYKSEMMKNQLAAKIRQESAKKKYEELLLEAEEMKKADKGFDLDRELKNPVFLKLIKCGFKVYEAWQFTHFEEILKELACASEQKGYETAVRAIREGTERPEENGTREQGGVSGKKSVNSLSGGNIRDILKRVENGAKIKF